MKYIEQRDYDKKLSTILERGNPQELLSFQKEYGRIIKDPIFAPTDNEDLKEKDFPEPPDFKITI